MTSFRTEIQPKVSDFPVRPDHPLLTVGSCFADTMGMRFSKFKFNALANPFGVTYNPFSIHSQLIYAVYNEPPADHTYLEHNGIVLNYNFHSRFSATSSQKIRQRISETTGAVHHFLKDARWLMITYGTSWVYARKDTGEIVANCHKVPQEMFSKELLSQKKILDSFETMYREIKRFNGSIRIILTVSPVRHIKDTLELNSVSKSVLRLACHTITEQYPDVHYFPANEMLMDDLRDYRFYGSDMIHPTETAEDYIWSKFAACYFDNDTRAFVNKWSDILVAIHHRPFHPSSTNHQKFLRNLLKSLEELKSMVNVDQEIEHIKSQLTG